MKGLLTKKVQGVKQILKERKDELFKLKIRLMVMASHEMIKHETDFVSHGLNEHRFQRIRHLFGLEDNEEESSFTWFDSLASR